MIRKYLSGVALAVLLGIGFAQTPTNASTVKDDRFASINIHPSVATPSIATGIPRKNWYPGVIEQLPDGGTLLGWTRHGYFVYGNAAQYPGLDYSQWHIDANGNVLSKGPDYYFGKGWAPLSLSEPDSNGKTTLVWGHYSQSFYIGVNSLEAVSIWTLDSTGTVISKGPINPIPGSGWQYYATWFNSDGSVSNAVAKSVYDNNGNLIDTHFKITQYATDGTVLSNGPDQFQKGQWSFVIAHVPSENDYNLEWIKYEYSVPLDQYIPDVANVSKLSPAGSIVSSWPEIHKEQSILDAWTLNSDGTALFAWLPISGLSTDEFDVWKANSSGTVTAKSGDVAGPGLYITNLEESPTSGYLLGWAAPNYVFSLWTLNDKLKVDFKGPVYNNPSAYWVPNLQYAPDGTIRLPLTLTNDETLLSFSALGDLTGVGNTTVYPDGEYPATTYYDSDSNYVEWYYGPTNGSPSPYYYSYYTKKDATGNVVYKSPYFYKK